MFTREITWGEDLEAEMTTGLAERSNKIKVSIWPPYNIPVPGGNKWQIKRVRVAAVVVATEKQNKQQQKKKKNIEFLGSLRGVDAVTGVI